MLRKMTIEDYEALLALWQSTPGLGLRSLDDSREGLGRFLRRNPETCFVAEADGVLTGAILCGHDGRRGYIYHTVVRPDCRGQGLGAALVERAVEALRAEGITRVCLNIMETNEVGRAFWTRLGWERKDFLGFYSRGITDEENRPLFEIPAPVRKEHTP